MAYEADIHRKWNNVGRSDGKASNSCRQAYTDNMQVYAFCEHDMLLGCCVFGHAYECSNLDCVV